MSKILLIVVVLSFLVGTILVGCGQQPVSEDTPTPTPTPIPTTSVPTSTQLTMLSITEGDVFIMKSGTNSWLEAQVGMTLESGDTIKAGDASRAVITFFEGSTIELEAGAEISVTELGTALDTGSTTISLKQEIGKTISRVEKLADPASRYEVETPGAVAVARGTIMHVHVDLQGGTTLGCEAGNVTGTAQGVTVHVPVGTQRHAKSGQSFGGGVPLGSPPPDEDEEHEDKDSKRYGGGGGGGGRSTTAAIAIAKTANTTQVSVGHNVTYTYVVTNRGDLQLSDVSVTDNKVSVVTYQSGDADGDGRLDTGETWIFTANYTVTEEDADPLVNVATASGTSGGRTVTDQDQASVDILRPAIAIAKAANCTGAHEGDEITYTYNVTNSGDTPLSNVSVSDNKTGDAAYQSGDTNGDNRLDVGETWIFSATYTVTGGDTNPLVNVATASGTDASGKTVSAQDEASVDILRPAIAIVKAANCTEAQEGDEITYTYNVTNSGDTPLSNVSVSDNKTGDAAYQSGDTNGDNKLDVDETWIFTANYTVTDGDTNPLVNLATASGTDALGKTVSAQASASVTIVIYGIRIELTWNATSDMDLHFIRPGGAYWDLTDDCHWRNNENPDWGLPGVVKDNPVYSGDVTDGYGPENIYLKQPYEVGTYQCKVNCWEDNGYGPSTATVTIWIDDVQVFQESEELSEDEVWDCASIEWPSGGVAAVLGGESYSPPPESAK
ncbi:FecR domain-containing protein [Chloroflexota bacterium]